MDPNEVSRPKNFLSEVEFDEKRKSYSEILSVVSFFSNKLLNSLKGTPILVVVSDADGYLLEIEGDETIKSTIEQFGIRHKQLVHPGRYRYERHQSFIATKAPDQSNWRTTLSYVSSWHCVLWDCISLYR